MSGLRGTEVPVRQTPVYRHTKLVVSSLRNIQPMEIVTERVSQKLLADLTAIYTQYDRLLSDVAVCLPVFHAVQCGAQGRCIESCTS